MRSPLGSYRSGVTYSDVCRSQADKQYAKGTEERMVGIVTN